MEIMWTMQDVKLIELIGPKKREYLKDKTNELETSRTKILETCIEV
jgi:hypothetical protein